MVMTLIGLVLGVVNGLLGASMTNCDLEFGSCYRLFGRPVSITTHWIVTSGTWGLGVGLAVGLLTWWLLRRRSLSPNSDTTPASPYEHQA